MREVHVIVQDPTYYCVHVNWPEEREGRERGEGREGGGNPLFPFMCLLSWTIKMLS